MNFFTNIIDGIKRKSAEAKDRKDFLRLVDEETKPLKRAAYLEQMKREAAKIGEAKAKLDAETQVPKKKTAEDFGFSSGLNDPYKFINGTKLNEEKK